MKKLRVAVVFGGRSAEHEISLLSARNVVASLDPEKYEPVLIGIDRQGRWLMGAAPQLADAAAGSGAAIRGAGAPGNASVRSSAGPGVAGDASATHGAAGDPGAVAAAADPLARLMTGDGADTVHLDAATHEVGLVSTGPTSELLMKEGGSAGKIDVIFPVLHGPYGEDGTIQGLAKLADIPCVGASVLGSAVGMDKDVMKRLLRDAGIPIAPFRTLTRRDRALSYDDIATELGSRLYVKPANLGSSVGISRAVDTASLKKAIDLAFRYDSKVIVEAEVKGREIEVSVLGNDEPVASIPGEIVPADGFYSYKAKYLDENGAQLLIPAQVTDAERATIQETAVRTFATLCCEGMARVDGFLTGDGVFVINEINTIPGFTRISMYPKLFEASGIPQRELIDRLITLAVERHEREQGLSLSPLDE